MTESRIALVTGGNRGIGLEIVRGLVRHGDRVFFTARREAAAVDAILALAKEGLRAEARIADVTDHASIWLEAEHIDNGVAT